MELVEYDVKVFIMQDIKLEDTGQELGKLLNETLFKNKEWEKIHYDRSFKGYCYNYLYPLESDKIYKRGKIYNFQIRVMNPLIESTFDKYLETYQNKKIKILIISKHKIKSDRIIDRIFTTTPLIIKNEFGYWKDTLNFRDFKKRISDNLMKKYYQVTGEKIFDHDLFTSVSIDNEKPVSLNYKNIKLLGDKITLHVNHDELTQKIIFVSLGFGVGELNNTIGSGYLNFKYYK